jgi:hypothetical protein
MTNQDIAQQISIEHGMLKHITDALRLALGWQMEGDDLSRKLSTVRFISQSLQRHLEHLMALEECRIDAPPGAASGRLKEGARSASPNGQSHCSPTGASFAF